MVVVVVVAAGVGEYGILRIKFCAPVLPFASRCSRTSRRVSSWNFASRTFDRAGKDSVVLA